MNQESTTATRLVPAVISPGQRAVLDHGVAATFFGVGAAPWDRHRPAATLARRLERGRGHRGDRLGGRRLSAR